jgi:apolipoprotein N-acyltransferase
LFSAGQARGHYLKKHLVPFGEYIPRPFTLISHWLGYPEPNIYPGPRAQALMSVQGYPIASLVCYELAYDQLLRTQLPQAAFIVSISDDGWFGHSLAMYQQQQIAQVRSLQTGRYQLVSNNDGLSAILNTQGDIVASLPGFSRGVLKGSVRPATGSTPWVKWGDWPVWIFLIFCLLLGTLRRYPYQPA